MRTADQRFPELLSRIRAGDKAALGDLYTDLFDFLWSLAVLQTRSGDLAHEIVHDVFLWIWTHRDRLTPDLDVRIYLAAAIRNRARNLGKHAHVVDAVVRDVQDARLDAPGIGAHDQPADAMVEQDEFHAAYRRALATLTERERTAVLLRWEEGFTLEQVSQVLGISIVGARKVVLRAQEKVRTGLSAYRE